MTDKEWLEDLKDQYHFYVEKGIAFNLEHSDIERLFMQAERVQELEAVLAFYANKKSYTEKVNDEWGAATAILVDRGMKAREALKGESDAIRALEVKQENPGQGWF